MTERMTRAQRSAANSAAHQAKRAAEQAQVAAPSPSVATIEPPPEPPGSAQDGSGEVGTGEAQDVSETASRAPTRARATRDAMLDIAGRWGRTIAERTARIAALAPRDSDAINAAKLFLEQTEPPIAQVHRHEVTQRQLSVVVHVGASGLPLDANARAALASVASGDALSVARHNHVYQTQLLQAEQQQVVTSEAQRYSEQGSEAIEPATPILGVANGVEAASAHQAQPALGPIEASGPPPTVSRGHAAAPPTAQGPQVPPEAHSGVGSSPGAPGASVLRAEVQGPQVPEQGSPAQRRSRSKLVKGAGGRAVDPDAPFEVLKRVPKGPQYPKRSDYKAEVVQPAPEVPKGGIGWMP